MPGRNTQPERHYINRMGWLRAAVLGANDEILSTGSLIIGVAAASATPKTNLGCCQVKARCAQDAPALPHLQADAVGSAHARWAAARKFRRVGRDTRWAWVLKQL